ncbi:hypothetical protein V6C27_13835 [Peptococcaceae bacterium 1198_IL3148]
MQKKNPNEGYALVVALAAALFFSMITLWLCPVKAYANEMNAHSPDPENLGIYVREIPVVLYNAAVTEIDGLTIKIDNPTWVWASEWTGKKYGVNEGDDLSNVQTEIFLLRTDKDTYSPTVTKEFRLPVANKGKHKIFDFITQGERGNISVTAKGPVPTPSAFHNQSSGINENLAKQYGLDTSFRLTPANQFGERYYHLKAQTNQGATAVYSVFDNLLNIDETYLRSTHLAPNYDQWVPEYDSQGNIINRDEADKSTSFYRGRNWNSQLGTESTLWVPGSIAAVSQNIDLAISTLDKYENLKLGSEVDIKVVVKNNSSVPVTTDLKYRINGSWKSAEDNIALQPQENKDLYIKVPVKKNPYSIIVKVNPAENKPAIETSWNNNTSVVSIAAGTFTPPPSPVPGSESKADITFKAVNQDGSVVREPGTAKWTDSVTATLTVTKPPIPFTQPIKGGDYISDIKVTGWNIEWAKITYPKKHSEFTFGNPLEPVGTKTVNMTPAGNSATATFKQDFSMDGAKVYNQVTKQLMADSPRRYPIHCQYRIKYTYEWIEIKLTEAGIVQQKYTGNDYIDGSVNKSLLVNGTGVNSRAQ